ncbi:MAG: UDP-3-O-(3-hydroxymyristoyl)glucosamine N-acyltransferase [Sedimentisphaerales bacterium]|nr:UDP-3-O-(3-hydroxymyristoyl)glucosamine N-acyltransferase [Sedimentisphaerales bacterium]
MEMTVEQLAKRLNADLNGNSNHFKRKITSIAPIKSANECNITFLTDDKHKTAITESKAGAVIVSKFIDGLEIPQLIVSNVNKSLIETMNIFATKLKSQEAGIHPTAYVAKSANVDEKASIGAFVVIGDEVEIGANTIISSGCRIGENSKIGMNCRIDYNVVIYHNCCIGSHVIIQANSTIGSVGFGYTSFEGRHHLIPHNGGVIIEDFVEIGANCCVDRAKFDNTIIGAGTKIDNLVQIAHNVVIGKYCLIAAQSAISGSTTLGDGCMLGGQSGLKDNIEVGKGVVIGAQAGVIKSVPDGCKMAWTPASEWHKGMQIMTHMRRLPKMAEQLKKLSDRIKELEVAKDDTK